MKQKPSVMNVIWLFLIVSSLAAAAFTGRMEEMSRATFDSAKSAVTLAIGFIGALLPAMRAVRLRMVDAMRYI